MKWTINYGTDRGLTNVLRQQSGELRRQADELRRQADELRRQANELRETKRRYNALTSH